MSNQNYTLTEAERLFILSFVGNVRCSSASEAGVDVSALYRKLGGPTDVPYIPGPIDFSVSAEDNFVLSERLRKYMRERVLNVRSSTPQRLANGRFRSKKWVARFTYPSSAFPYNNIPRVVVTEYTGKRRPNLIPGENIKGFDKTRNGLRSFVPSNIRGSITWSKEYVS